MSCQAIEVKGGREKQCSSEATIEGLCTFHYVLAKGVISRHKKGLELAIRANYEKR